MTYRDIINLWGSYQELADDLGAPRDRVRKWYERDSVPCEFWGDMLALARLRRLPLTAEHLITAAADRAA